MLGLEKVWSLRWRRDLLVMFTVTGNFLGRLKSAEFTPARYFAGNGRGGGPLTVEKVAPLPSHHARSSQLTFSSVHATTITMYL